MELKRVAGIWTWAENSLVSKIIRGGINGRTARRERFDVLCSAIVA